MENKIDKNTTLSKILEFGEAEKVLLKHKVPCMGCPFAKMEMEKLKIGDICRMYGIDEENLLKDLNRALNVYNK